MESLLKTFLIILIALFIGIGCKPDDPDPDPNPNPDPNPDTINNPNPDPDPDPGDTTVVTLRDCFPYVEIDTVTTPDFINIYIPDSFKVNGVVDLLYANCDYDKIQLVVVYNGYYNEQNVIIDNITTLPMSFSLSASKIVSAIRQLYTPDDFKEDDEFHFFTVPVISGEANSPYELVNGNLNTKYNSGLIDSLKVLKGVDFPDWKVKVVDPGHPLAAWIGKYYVNAVSYSSPTPGEYDENWYCVVTEDSSDVRNILIYGIGKNIGVGVPAMIDTLTGTITIKAGTSIGDVYNYGDVLLYQGTADIIRVDSDIVGTISEDGSMEMDLFGMALTGKYAGYMYDVFNTHWTKDNKSASLNEGYIPESKRARFRE